jgi:hypothetical protein
MILLSLMLLLLPAAHPVHVSLTNLEVDLAKHEIRITQKLYTEDFSLLFYHLYEKNIRFTEGKDLSENDSHMISSYMDAAFVLESGKDRLSLTYAGKEQDEESLWLHYTCRLPEKMPARLTLTNSLLLQLFDDQTNLVIVTVGAKEKGYTFTQNSWKADIPLDF